MEESWPRPLTRPAILGGMPPVEVAAGLRHLPGLVFFDSAGNLPSGVSRPLSVIAARPRRILRGSIHQAAGRAALREALAAAPTVPGDHAFPPGGLCGWVDYEGAFVFGDYREMLVFDHSDHAWWETGDLSTCLRDPAGEPAEIGRFAQAIGRDPWSAGVRTRGFFIARRSMRG